MTFGVGLLLLTICVVSISGQRLIWSDEFNGNGLDERKWEYQIGDGCQYGICGWGNGELQWYRRENVQVRNGRLIIEARRQDFSGKRYTSSRLRTMHKGDWKFGKILVRAKLPKGQGVWPAIWMLPTDNKYGIWPRSGEIDIAEARGQTPRQMEMTAHFGNAWNDKSQRGTTFTLPHGSFSDDFHTFGIEWRHDYIKWFVDDSEKFSMRRSDTHPFNYPFNERFHLLLNVAIGGGYGGNPGPDNIFPTSMEVDWVRVYQ